MRVNALCSSLFWPVSYRELVGNLVSGYFTHKGGVSVNEWDREESMLHLALFVGLEDVCNGRAKMLSKENLKSSTSRRPFRMNVLWFRMPPPLKNKRVIWTQRPVRLHSRRQGLKSTPSGPNLALAAWSQSPSEKPKPERKANEDLPIS